MTYAFILLANAIPLAGLYAFGWSPRTLAFLFWYEAAVIGAFTLLKVAASLPGDVRGPGTHVTYRRQPRPGRRASVSSSVPRVHPLAAVPLFVLLYGAVLAGYGALLCVSLKEQSVAELVAAAVSSRSVQVAMAVVAAGQLWAFWRDYVRGPAWQRGDPTFWFWRPFGLAIVTWLAFFFGFFLLGWIDSKVVVLTVLVLLKAMAEAFNALVDAQAGEWRRDDGTG